MQVWLRGPPRGVKVLEFLEFWNPDGDSDCKFTMKMEVGRLGAPAAKTSKLKLRKRQDDPSGAGGKSGEIRRVLEPGGPF